MHVHAGLLIAATQVYMWWWRHLQVEMSSFLLLVMLWYSCWSLHLNNLRTKNSNFFAQKSENRKPKTKPLLIGTWYRSPSSSLEVFDKFEMILHRLEDTNLDVSIAGDLNCNVSASSPDTNTTRLLEICSLYQYSQLIRQHTRITSNTSTTIDWFITNETQKYSVSGVCHLGISYHSLIYSFRKLCVPKTRPIIQCRKQTIWTQSFQKGLPTNLNLQYNNVWRSQWGLGVLEESFPGSVRLTCSC